MKVLIKWRVDGLPVVIDENKAIWKEPFQSGLRTYGYKQIFFHYHQNKSKLLINNKRYTKDYLKSKMYRVKEYHELPIDFEDCPF